MKPVRLIPALLAAVLIAAACADATAPLPEARAGKGSTIPVVCVPDSVTGACPEAGDTATAPAPAPAPEPVPAPPPPEAKGSTVGSV